MWGGGGGGGFIMMIAVLRFGDSGNDRDGVRDGA